MGEQQRQKGTVKWFNATKGFGFITPDSGGDDLFVHQTSINAEGFRSLREGEKVEYDVEGSPDGRTKATRVSGPNGAPPQGAPRRPHLSTSSVSTRGVRNRGRFPSYYGGYDGGYYVGYYYPRGRGRGRIIPGPYPGRSRGPPPGQPGESSGYQVVVHNLPWACSWQQLKDAFKEFKVERADVIVDGWGRSRGFGTVRLASKEEADAACEKKNNTEIEGRVISVRIDRYA